MIVLFTKSVMIIIHKVWGIKCIVLNSYETIIDLSQAGNVTFAQI